MCLKLKKKIPNDLFSPQYKVSVILASFNGRKKKEMPNRRKTASLQSHKKCVEIQLQGLGVAGFEYKLSC